MADYSIFVVGSSADYTQYLKTQDYSITREDVLDTWVDGNHITRASVIRTRLTGSIHLVMRKDTFNTFLTDWASAKNADGTHNVKLRIGNATTTTALVTAKVFATIESSVVYGTKSYGYYPAGMDVVIQIEEA